MDGEAARFVQVNGEFSGGGVELVLRHALRQQAFGESVRFEKLVRRRPVLRLRRRRGGGDGEQDQEGTAEEDHGGKMRGDYGLSLNKMAN